MIKANELLTLPDYFWWATNLKVYSIFSRDPALNPTGYVTPEILYKTARQIKGGRAPQWQGGAAYIEHGTVGRNTLPYFAEGYGEPAGVVAEGRYACTHYLNPKDSTRLGDGRILDTTLVMFKMVPDGFACNHVGEAEYRAHGKYYSQSWLESHAYGIEHENMQNGTDPFTPAQLIKGALVYVYLAAKDGISDLMHISHKIIATPFGRRGDPDAGPFDWQAFLGHIHEIRKDRRIWQFWSMLDRWPYRPA